jgi:hypothetical protein
MRLPKTLSNSALQLWESDRREYYLKYLCDTKTPKIAQTRPMAVGSSFDGMVKNSIENMLGLPVRDYLGQIEAEDKRQALEDGRAVMDYYRSVNGISRLLVTGMPRMEFSVEGEIPGTSNCIGGPVRLSGKPDLYYKIGGHSVVHDWKVNGYCSSASPQPGYVWDSKTQGPHKNVIPKVMLVGDRKFMIGRHDHFAAWIDQLTAYGWLLGEALGDEFLLQVHQITRGTAGLRLTEHRCYTDKAHQMLLRDRYVGMWEAIHMNRCFTDMPPADDVAEQRSLDLIAAGMQDPVFNMVCGR